MSVHPIIVFTDGAAKGNPGPGGWGVVIVSPAGHVVELGGGAGLTTNNKMELTGAIEALQRLNGTMGAVAIYTDSTYVIQGISKWIWGWRRRGWKTADGGDVQNRELWERLAREVDARGANTIAWHYVRGHSGIPGNERVDEIANAF
ncbi:MAG: ribonuclease HI, partial [Acidobacteriota bacterium]